MPTPSSISTLTVWSRRLAAASTDAASVLVQCCRRFHGFSAALPEVSAEAAGAAARRSVPLLQLPAPLELELEEILTERGLTPKEARRLGQELTDRLKSLSHTPQRGGHGPSGTVLARGGRLRSTELLAAREAFEAGQLLTMDDRAVNAALGLPPPLRDDERHAPQMHKLAPKYKTDSEVLAYIVSRLSPEYAVCRRVLDEAVRLLEAAAVLPGEAAVKWRPREALVYGAGVGAAVVAAFESCSSPSLTRLVALEPSSVRQMLGTRVEQAYHDRQRQVQEQQQTEGQHGGTRKENAVWLPGQRHRDKGARRQPASGPVVSWVHALPPLSKAVSGQRRRYDLVIAPYQLTILPTVEERRRLVRELWDRCGDVLVLVEPGTPRGFAAIAEARELLLSRENRKRGQLETAIASASGGHHRAEDGSSADPRAVSKLRGAGAYVVAPCPHDGACPMQARKRQWCHFSQPLLLPVFMQQAMVTPGDKAQGRGRALNVQDERFSYLILRRGRRPSFRTAVARDLDGSGGNSFTAPSSASSSPFVPSRLPPRVVLSQVMLNRAAAATAAATSSDVLPAENRQVVEGGNDAALFARPAAGPGGKDSGKPAVVRRMPLFGANESSTALRGDAAAHQPRLSAASSNPNTMPSKEVRGAACETADLAARGLASEWSGGHGSSGRSTDGVSSDGGIGPRPSVSDTGAAGIMAQGPVINAFESKYPAFGPGLVGRLVALQEAGIDWTAVGRDEAADEPQVTSAAVRTAGAAAQSADQAVGHRNQPAVATEGRDNDASAHNHGLNAAVAELSVSIVTGLRPLTPEGPQISRPPASQAGALSEVAEAAALAEGTAEQGPVSAIPTSSFNVLDMRSTEPREPTALTDVGVSQLDWAQGGQQQVAREDVSDEEFNKAELQLIERIYGAEAAHAWLRSRQVADPTAADASEAVSWDGVNDQVAADANQEIGLDASGDLTEMKSELTEESIPASDEVLRLAEASSYGWGRLVRSPRLRGGHVILDMCVGPQHHYPDNLDEAHAVTRDVPLVAAAAAAASEPAGMTTDTNSSDGGHSEDAKIASGDNFNRSSKAGCAQVSEALLPDAEDGRLVQQVVAKSARRGWMGAPAYRLARRLSWGDCWPDWYIRGHNARETAVPAPPLESTADKEL